MSLRVGVLVSGEGTNLQAILDSVHGSDGIEVVAVASSRAEARGLERARAAGVETAVFDARDHPGRDGRDLAMTEWLEERGVELVVLAGFMELLTPAFVRAFARRILNVHPSLLPAFPGLRALEQAIDYGARVAGVTVHFVDEGVDTGPIVLQESFELPYAAGIAEVEYTAHAVEHDLLPRAIRLFAAGALSPDPDNPRRIRVREGADVGH